MFLKYITHDNETVVRHDDIHHVFDELKSQKAKIKSINLCFNKIGLENTKEFQNCIHELSELQSLNLFQNELNSLTTTELTSFIQAMPKSLQSIDFKKNNLDIEKLNNIFEILPQHLPSLRFLNLSENPFEFATAEEFVNTIQKLPKSLHTIHFEQTNVTEEHLNAIATCDLLTLPKIPEKIDFDSIHQITPLNKDTIVLINETLYIVNFQAKNVIEINKIKASKEYNNLCRYMNQLNPGTLQKITDQTNMDIHSVIIALTGRTKIAIALENNYSLTNFFVDDNLIHTVGYQCIDRIIQRNRHYIPALLGEALETPGSNLSKLPPRLMSHLYSHFIARDVAPKLLPSTAEKNVLKCRDNAKKIIGNRSLFKSNQVENQKANTIHFDII